MAKGRKKARDLKRMMTGGLVRLTTPARDSRGGTDGHSASPGPDAKGFQPHLGDQDENGPWLRLGSIMTAILAAGLAWIGIVCWLVSRMPER